MNMGICQIEIRFIHLIRLNLVETVINNSNI